MRTDISPASEHTLGDSLASRDPLSSLLPTENKKKKKGSIHDFFIADFGKKRIAALRVIGSSGSCYCRSFIFSIAREEKFNLSTWLNKKQRSKQARPSNPSRRASLKRAPSSR